MKEYRGKPIKRCRTMADLRADPRIYDVEILLKSEAWTPGQHGILAVLHTGLNEHANPGVHFIMEATVREVCARLNLGVNECVCDECTNEAGAPLVDIHDKAWMDPRSSRFAQWKQENKQ